MTSLTFLEITVLLTQFTSIFSFDYCSIDQCPKKHTMCRYPDRTQGECSGQYTGISDEMKKAIVHQHNELRAKLARGEEPGQPPASNMMKLSWNEEAETIAQRWTNQCTPKLSHDACRYSKDGTSMGQNAFSSGLDLSNYTYKRAEAVIKAVNAFYIEVKHYSPYSVGNFNSSYSSGGKVIGHYTALVWANTDEVGCGYVEKKATNSRNKYYIMHCNYKPTGNILGSPVYKKGLPCSKCPTGTDCSRIYPGLCTQDNESPPGQASFTQMSVLLFVSSLMSILYHTALFS